jgi:hypothetical protein
MSMRNVEMAKKAIISAFTVTKEVRERSATEKIFV